MVHEEVQKDRGEEMDCNVNEVVAEDVFSSHVIIQGKAQAGNRPVNLVGLKPARVERFFQVLPSKFREVQGGIGCNIRFIIEMPGGIEGVCVDSQDYDQQGDKGEDLLSRFREMSFWFQMKYSHRF